MFLNYVNTPRLVFEPKIQISIDEVVIPRTLLRYPRQLEASWKTTLETRVLNPLTSEPDGSHKMEVQMGSDCYHIFFIIGDLRFSPRNRKKLVATHVIKLENSAHRIQYKQNNLTLVHDRDN